MTQSASITRTAEQAQALSAQFWQLVDKGKPTAAQLRAFSKKARKLTASRTGRDLVAILESLT